MDTIIVKKSGDRLCVLRIATIFVLCLYLKIVISAQSFILAILCAPFVVLSFLMNIHHETWKITLYRDKIAIRVYFSSKYYDYSQIRDARYANSSTLGWHVRLCFADGKKVIIRMSDENAQKAANRISKHRSIRIV